MKTLVCGFWCTKLRQCKDVKLASLPSFLTHSSSSVGVYGCYSSRYFPNPLIKDKTYLFYIRSQFVPRSKHSASVMKTNQLMLHKEIVSVCCENHLQRVTAM